MCGQHKWECRQDTGTYVGLVVRLLVGVMCFVQWCTTARLILTVEKTINGDNISYGTSYFISNGISLLTQLGH